MAHVLVVDDDKAVNETIRIILEDGGHEVTTAINGIVACKELEKQTFDLLITDILMPDKDGLEILIEARTQWPDLKIIAISGGGRVWPGTFLNTAKGLGATSVMQKPFSSTELTLKVDQILQN